MSSSHYNVAPRYTAGSPAMVDERIALQVAQEERQFIEHYLEGAYGEESRKLALEKGLGGIVERRWEVKEGWLVEDIITGRRFYRLTLPAKKVQHGDIVVDFLGNADVVYRHGQEKGAPFSVRRVEMAGNSLYLTDPDYRRLVVGRNHPVRVEREEKKP